MIAVSGCTLALTDASLTAASIVVQSAASGNVLVSGKGVYKGAVSVLVSSITQGTYLCASVLVTIQSSGSNVLLSSEKALLKGDKGSADGSFTNTVSPFDAKTVSVEVEVSDAGQNYVTEL